jgi:hypothetical protein
VSARDRIEPLGVEIRHLDDVPGAGESLDGPVLEGTGEGTRLGMGIHDENMHGMKLPAMRI